MPASSSFYLGAETPAFARPHVPSGEPRGAVLLVPPFGWDEVCAYRSLRALAEQLRETGRLVLRIDLPGTGDAAGGPLDSDRVGAWRRALADAVDWLAAEAPGRRIAAVGLGLPGTVLGRAVLDGLGVDDLALWAVEARGRRAVRTLSAFARLEEADASAAAADGDGFVAGGYRLSAETTEALGGIELAPAPGAGDGRRALLLGRESEAPAAAAVAAFADSGFDTEEGQGPGWSSMMLEPALAEVPVATWQRVVEWIEAGGVHGARSGGTRAPETGEQLSESAWVEEPFVVPTPFGGGPGVLTRPTDGGDLGILFLNAGGIRRTGPNRLWVELSRRFAALGVAAARIDIEGIGDAGGRESGRVPHRFYEPGLLRQIEATVDLLTERGLARRWLLVGLCSGAYHALHVGLAHPLVQGAAAINGGAIEWHDNLIEERETRRLRGRARERASGQDRKKRPSLRRMARVALRLARPRRNPARRFGREATRILDGLRDQDKRILIAFGDGEPLRDELELGGVLATLDRWPNLELGSLPTAVHTLRPIHAQRALTILLDRYVAEERAREWSRAARPPVPV